MIRLLILDFDDTIIDNIYLDHQSFVFSCKKLGLPSPTFEKIVSLRKQGLIASEIISKIIEKKIGSDIISKFLLLRQNFLKDKDSMKFLKLKDGTEKLFLMLKRHKINCILCTSRKDKQFVLEFLKKQNIYHYLSKIFHNQSEGSSLNNVDPLNRLLIKKCTIQNFSFTIPKSYALL